MHALPSLQDEPSLLLGFEQVPVVGSHVPTTWHWSRAEQVTPAPPQTPLVQLSFRVQALLSLQEEPSVLFGFEHVPVAASHVPAM